MLGLARKIFGSKNDREIKRITPYVGRVNELEAQFKALADSDFPNKTNELKARVAAGTSLDEVIPEAFALIREAARRVRGERHFDVQLIGGIVLHEGKIAEMKTGEGKTLTATTAIFLNALSGKGAHVVTVNDYLAQRDAQTMGAVYAFVGMKTGVIVHGLNDTERREAYACDITYGTNNEFGFDYLRDNMKTDPNRLVQRGHNFAIVDEVDSILIDEARTPLIISGPTDTNLDLYVKVNATIPGLQKDSDYTVDEKSRAVALTEDGISKLEKRLRIENLYDPASIDYLHHVQQALKAHVIFKKDVDYVVRDSKVLIVDEFTGRLMPGRRYSDGLHGALEAKEHVEVQTETQTMATVTFQNYFRLYSKLSGMTGTADTEAVEFKKIYNLDVVVIPTNRKMVRKDHEDVVFRSAREKFNVIAEEIEAAQKRGQPVLVGTVSVEKSELLSTLLKKRGVNHEVLNAKNHAREAEIIKNAGQSGNVTISTNMAGRGTDIVLGAGVTAAGGLYVMGTERHESRRIDNQLRGRSGRQGDPGETKFFLSLEDDLMRIFASDRLSSIMGRLGMKEGEAIVSPMVSRAIERAQKRVEEHNFSSRKHLLEYDDVMNQQRQVVYGIRRHILDGNAHQELGFVDETVRRVTARIIGETSPEATNTSEWDLEKTTAALRTEYHVQVDFKGIDPASMQVETLAREANAQIMKAYRDKTQFVGAENMARIEAFIYLQVIDRAWKNHLLGMDALKDSVSLRGYGQRDPLQEYKKEAFRLFEMLIGRIEEETTTALINLEPPKTSTNQTQLRVNEPDEESLTMSHPSAQQYEAEQARASAQAAQNGENGQNAGGGASTPVSRDGMIYYGSRSAPPQQAVQRPAVQTYKREMPKVGRNDPCPCGSGKKYKKCHGEAGEDQPPA